MVKQAEEQKAAALAEYEAMKEKMSGIASSVMARGPFKVSKRVGENDAIFGSVTTSQVLDLMRSEYADVPEKCDVNLPEIKKLGTYPVSVQLHPEVMTTVQLEVVADKLPDIYTSGTTLNIWLERESAPPLPPPPSEEGAFMEMGP